MRTQNFQFALDCTHVFVLSDALEAIAHDCDQHIQHNNIGEECCENEEEEDEFGLWVL